MVGEIKLHERGFFQKGDINSSVSVGHLIVPCFISIEPENYLIFVEKICTTEDKDSPLHAYAEEELLPVPFPPASKLSPHWTCCSRTQGLVGDVMIGGHLGHRIMKW